MIETRAPVLPSSRVCAFAPEGILYFPFGTSPSGAPPACFCARAAIAITPPNSAVRTLRRVAMPEPMSCAAFSKAGRDLPGNVRTARQQDASQGEQQQGERERGPAETPDDRRNERDASQCVGVGHARLGTQVQQIVPDVVERVAGGKGGE